MNHRFWLFRRRGIFYVEDTLTRRQESLGTRDLRVAEQLRSAKETAFLQPHATLAIGKAYLAAHDPQLVRRTWRSVMDDFVQRGQDQTRERKVRAMNSAPFRILASRKLVETTADDLRQVMSHGGASTKLFLRCLHNLALGLGWLCASAGLQPRRSQDLPRNSSRGFWGRSISGWPTVSAVDSARFY